MNSAEKATMIQNLETLPDAIKTMENSLLKNRKEYDEMKHRIALYELEVEKSVNIAVDEDGKKQFSNDILRKAEIAIRLRVDVQYKNNSEALQDIKNEIDTAQINLNFLVNRHRSLIAISRIMGD